MRQSNSGVHLGNDDDNDDARFSRWFAYRSRTVRLNDVAARVVDDLCWPFATAEAPVLYVWAPRHSRPFVVLGPWPRRDLCCPSCPATFVLQVARIPLYNVPRRERDGSGCNDIDSVPMHQRDVVRGASSISTSPGADRASSGTSRGHGRVRRWFQLGPSIDGSNSDRSPGLIRASLTCPPRMCASPSPWPRLDRRWYNALTMEPAKQKRTRYPHVIAFNLGC